MRVKTNVTSEISRNSLKRVSRALVETNQKISSSDRIYQSSFDPAGLAISEKMNSEIRSAHQARRNANDGISFIQVAEARMGEIQNMALRLRELSMQAASDTVDDVNRRLVDLEYQAVKAEIERTVGDVNFNGKNLLGGNGQKYEFQVGIKGNPQYNQVIYDTKKVANSLNRLGITSSRVGTKSDAQKAIGETKRMIATISQSRTELGALQSRLQSVMQNLDYFRENMSAGKSRIRDADIAYESANKASYQIRQGAATASVKLANDGVRKGVEKLLENY